MTALSELDAKATQGEFQVDDDTHLLDCFGDSLLASADDLEAGMRGEFYKADDVAFIVAIVNAYRTGQLVERGEGVVVPVELTAENGAKAALMGEFKFQFGEYTPNVPWTTIKEIHRAIVKFFAAAQGRKP